ncbi:MAG: hypothetical protein AB7Y46_15315 [Armatimonadota bacterium]
MTVPKALCALAVAAALMLNHAAVAHPELKMTALQVLPRLDLRATGGDPDPTTVQVEQAEINVTASLAWDDAELVSLNLQHGFETAMTGRAKDMHFGNLYGVFNFGLGSPKVKLGQFVVPFGALAEYDTHPLVLQTPFARTLGIRIDRGLGLEGAQGEYDWWLTLTSGDGRERFDGGWAATAHVARDYEQGGDVLRWGASVLVGENMPVFPLDAMSMPMGMDEMVTHTDKWRVALDLDWLRGIDNIRAELVAGQDEGEFVDGQWLCYEHPFSYDASLAVQVDRWRQSDGTAHGGGVQYHQALDDLSGLRLAYEHRWAYRRGLPDLHSDTVTLQYYRDWAWAPSL